MLRMMMEEGMTPQEEEEVSEEMVSAGTPAEDQKSEERVETSGN